MIPRNPTTKDFWDAELGRTAMRFVDRAGDVHPGIDDAEIICADFHKAMVAVIDRMPHVKSMRPQSRAVTLYDLDDDWPIVLEANSEHIVILRVTSDSSVHLADAHSIRNGLWKHHLYSVIEQLKNQASADKPVAANLWAALEHNLLHFGANHSSVMQLCTVADLLLKGKSR
jgi:hypothetical protein